MDVYYIHYSIKFNVVEFKDTIMPTQQKMNNLLQVDENSIEQYFAALHIVLGC